MVQKFHNSDVGLLLIRLGLAAIFIYHGWGKIDNMEQTVGFFSSLGLSAVWTYAVAWVEFVGGISLLLGLWTEYSAVALSVVMVGAIYLVHWKNGFGGQGGYEFQLLILLSTLSLVFFGSGKYSLGAMMNKDSAPTN